MKLRETRERPAILNFPPSRGEWWDIGDGYEIYVDVCESDSECGIGIDGPSGCITYEVALYLGLTAAKEDLLPGVKSNEGDLYLSWRIDCVVLNYAKPENYQELLLKIEAIVNEHFKGK